MKYRFLFSFLFFIAATLYVSAQDSTEYYWVRFADKNGTAGAIDNPHALLSQRALDRRHRLHIAIDSADLPVAAQYLEALRQKGARIHNVSKWLNGASVIADSAIAGEIAKLPFVKCVQLCLKRSVVADTAKVHYADKGSYPDQRQ